MPEAGQAPAAVQLGNLLAAGDSALNRNSVSGKVGIIGVLRMEIVVLCALAIYQFGHSGAELNPASLLFSEPLVKPLERDGLAVMARQNTWVLTEKGREEADRVCKQTVPSS